ncbi:MAG: peptidoglycan editing factor PgeF [Lachnospiraceae bacterium]|nr:peptidoglycan editing factor PgeF [Lachnospiraceae bacterium]
MQNWKKKAGASTLYEKEREGVPYLVFSHLEETQLVCHGFSTRLGGVSEGMLSTMNLSFSRGDDPGRVRENYGRMGRAVGFSCENLVFSHQTHTTHVRRVTEADRGKGYLFSRDYENVDGLITNVPGLVLTTFYADCVPLFFLDPVHKAIGLSHSGWRGTAGGMGPVTLRAMAQEFGTEPSQVLAAIGPSICQDCYEVSQDVIEEFQKTFPPEQWPKLYQEKEEKGKYQLDLWQANELLLLGAGIRPEHLSVTNICTCCNPELLFSHRASKGKRGNLAAFLMLKEESPQ